MDLLKYRRKKGKKIGIILLRKKFWWY